MDGVLSLDATDKQLSELAGVVAVATAAMVEHIAEVIDADVLGPTGFTSVEHWVTVRTGVSYAHARRLVAAARHLRRLPRIAAAFAAGELTEDHVAVIVRADVTPVHDDQVLELARHTTVSQLTKGLSFLPRPEPEPATADQPAAHPEPAERRTQVGFGVDDDGLWKLRACLHPDDGALVERALHAARDHLFRDRHPDALGPGETVNDVSWSDALVRLAHTAMDGLDPDSRAGRSPGHRYQVIIHWDPATGATAGPDPAPIDPGTRRQLSCDAVIRPWFATPGQPVTLGRRARVVDDKLRTVIEHRDRGCVIPGCGRTRWLLIHHLHHWEHGGTTNPDNLVALCAEHHRAVHRDQVRITGNPELGPLTVTDAHGHPMGPSPPTPPGRPPADAARHHGLPEPAYTPRSGERAQWKWLDWRPHPSNN